MDAGDRYERVAPAELKAQQCQVCWKFFRDDLASSPAHLWMPVST